MFFIQLHRKIQLKSNDLKLKSKKSKDLALTQPSKSYLTPFATFTVKLYTKERKQKKATVATKRKTSNLRLLYVPNIRT